MEWIKNRYRYTDLDSMGNSLARPFLVVLPVEFVQGDGADPAGGHRAAAPATRPERATARCRPPALPHASQRQVNKDPATVAQAADLRGGWRRLLLRRDSRASTSTMRPRSSASSATTAACRSPATMVVPLQRRSRALGDISRTRRTCCSSCSVRRATSSQTCDVDGDGDVDTDDLALIRAGIGQAPAPGDPRDANLDGKITMNDVRVCTLRCTRASCATH